MQNLKVSLIQTSLHWEDRNKNLVHFSQLLDDLKEKNDLIVLPEMFSTGFTMNVNKCAEAPNGKSFQWLKNKAVEHNCVITGSLLIKENEKYFNRFFWMNPDGSYETYNKRHLFRMGNEHLTMTAGQERKIIRFKDWRINLQICYDLRFPVWSKNTYQEGQFEYDAIIYVANWPEIRKHAYLPLLKARAIENQAYVIWVNRIGKDNNDIEFSGNTMVVDPYGQIISQAEEHKSQIISVNLSGDKLLNSRKKFNLGLDWDRFEILP